MYELAYHMKPDLEEAKIKTHMQDVESLITQNGGTVSTSRDPKKVHLSYPITRHHEAYMGVMDFSGPADMLAGVNAQLKLQEGILRFLIIHKPEGKELRTFGEQRSRKIRTHVTPTPKPIEKASPAEEKQMEKKLEDVLEKI